MRNGRNLWTKIFWSEQIFLRKLKNLQIFLENFTKRLRKSTADFSVTEIFYGNKLHDIRSAFCNIDCHNCRDRRILLGGLILFSILFEETLHSHFKINGYFLRTRIFSKSYMSICSNSCRIHCVS